jgi:transcriptional regulator with XRE-family HTH domain
VEIKVLARRGTALREIAKQTGLSRNTVRRYLRDEQAGRYKQREPRATKLDPFKGYLLERVAAARPHWIPATVLLRELQEAGYLGGISQLALPRRLLGRCHCGEIARHKLFARLRVLPPREQCRGVVETVGDGARERWALPRRTEQFQYVRRG